eukprot:4553266-Karenia_brevis.AAC.1
MTMMMTMKMTMMMMVMMTMNIPPDRYTKQHDGGCLGCLLRPLGASWAHLGAKDASRATNTT